MSFSYLSLDQTAYADALVLQEALFHSAIAKKLMKKPVKSTLIFLQHDPVYTLGKSGDKENLIVPIENTDAEFFQTNRGGDITFHGPGQLVGYPIFDLDSFGMGVRTYVESIEECIIQCLSDYGLKGVRVKGASGVWLDAGTPNERKICAIGIKISRGISMHGFAFNINTDLSYYKNIVPCGIDDKGITSLSNELKETVDFKSVSDNLLQKFEAKFKLA